MRYAQAAALAGLFVSTMSIHAWADDACAPAEFYLSSAKDLGATQGVYRGADYVDRFKVLYKAVTGKDIEGTGDGIVVFVFPSGIMGVTVSRGDQMCFAIKVHPSMADFVISALAGHAS